MLGPGRAQARPQVQARGPDRGHDGQVRQDLPPQPVPGADLAVDRGVDLVGRQRRQAGQLPAVEAERARVERPADHVVGAAERAGAVGVGDAAAVEERDPRFRALGRDVQHGAGADDADEAAFGIVRDLDGAVLGGGRVVLVDGEAPHCRRRDSARSHHLPAVPHRRRARPLDRERGRARGVGLDQARACDAVRNALSGSADDHRVGRGFDAGVCRGGADEGGLAVGGALRVGARPRLGAHGRARGEEQARVVEGVVYDGRRPGEAVGRDLVEAPGREQGPVAQGDHAVGVGLGAV